MKTAPRMNPVWGTDMTTDQSLNTATDMLVGTLDALTEKNDPNLKVNLSLNMTELTELIGVFELTRCAFAKTNPFKDDPNSEQDGRNMLCGAMEKLGGAIFGQHRELAVKAMKGLERELVDTLKAVAKT